MVTYGIPDQHQQSVTPRDCTGRITTDTNIQHLHDETNTLPMHKHLQLHASQVRHKAQNPPLSLYRYTTHYTSERLMKPSTLNNPRYTINITTDPCIVTTAEIKANMRDMHTSIVSQHLAARGNNKYCAHTHRKSPAPKKTYPGMRVAPSPNYEEIKPNLCYHIYTKSTF